MWGERAFVIAVSWLLVLAEITSVFGFVFKNFRHSRSEITYRAFNLGSMFLFSTKHLPGRDETGAATREKFV